MSDKNIEIDFKLTGTAEAVAGLEEFGEAKQKALATNDYQRRILCTRRGECRKVFTG